MGWGAGRKLWEVLANTARVLAVEVVCAVEGIEHRRPLRPGTGTAAAAGVVRSVVPALEADRPPGPAIEAVAALIRSGSLQDAVAGAIGSLR
jgi:histidine ammonia-lyase